MQNFTGAVFEQQAIQRGLVAGGVGGVAVGGATWAGKELSQRAPSGTAQAWRNVAVSAGSAAAQGAAMGCVAGAAAGLVTGGALSGVGCMAAGLGGAIASGFMGAYGALMNLDEDGLVQISKQDLNELAQLLGSQTATAVEAPVQQDQVAFGCYVTDTDGFEQRFAAYGPNRIFACQRNGVGESGYNLAAFIELPFKKPSGSSQYGRFHTLDNRALISTYNCDGVTFPSLTYRTGCTPYDDPTYWRYAGGIHESLATGTG